MNKFIFKGFLSNKFCSSLLVRARSSRAELTRILIEPSSSLKSQLDFKFELEPSQLESSSSRARAGSSSARLGSFTALTRFMPPVARAFRKWATASQYFTFSRASTYQGADLKIIFARGAHGDNSPFDGPGGVLAHAFAPTDGRFHYDADERWVVGAVPTAYDVETLALHEIGHLLGLGHSQFSNAIMWATFSPGVTKGLNSDDIRGIRALYGS
ncbi:putative matrilysin [Helianthus annuus]|nr:putative matrilysin [Helianthus annuus]KAJ0851371.1 putative matrilysin [Helianthus annuus]